MLKKHYILIAVLFSSLMVKSQCNDQLLVNASEKLDAYVYVRDFKIKLKEAKKEKDPKYATYTVILNKEVKYRFVIEDAKEYEGRLIFELFGDRGKIMSSYNADTGKYYSVVEYACKKSGIHYINLSFLDTKEGCGILVYSFQKN